MKTHTDSSSAITVGIDLGDRKHAICVLDAEGSVLNRETITNSRPGLTALSRGHPGALMVMEVGTHSPWVSRFLKDLGHRILVANPRNVRAIYQNDLKSDRRDAEMLARIARTDESLLQIKLRDNLMRQRVDVISAVRFTLKSLGTPLPSPNSASFSRHASSDPGRAMATEFSLYGRRVRCRVRVPCLSSFSLFEMHRMWIGPADPVSVR